MPNRKHLQHIKSSQLNKVPTAEDLLYGEIAVNYAKDGETLYIKNANGEIVSFPNSKVIEENEFVIASHLAELDEKISQSNTDFGEKERVIAEALVEHNDRLNELDTVIEDNELVTAQGLAQLEQDLSELDEITAAATRQLNYDILRLANDLENANEEINTHLDNIDNAIDDLEDYIEAKEEITAQALSDLNEKLNKETLKEIEVLTINSNNEQVKPNAYTILRSTLDSIDVNLEPESALLEKTYTIEVNSSFLPNIQDITWPDNIIWEGNNEPDITDFTQLGYDSWLVTINNGYLASYKRYWTSTPANYALLIVNGNGQKYTIDCSEIENGTLTNDFINGVKSMFSDAYIYIGDCVTSIGTYAFDGCVGVTSITIPSSVTSIGQFAFRGCSSLTSIEIPSGVTTIAPSTFYNCSSLTSVEIPSGVTTIDSQAFYNCSSLTSLEIPSSVTSIYSNAFNYCSGLTSITVDANNTVYDSRDNCNAIIKKSNNALLVGCNNTVIPSSVTSIDGYAFYNCVGLTSIEIPSGVTTIGHYAFDGCSGATSITIPSTLTSTGNYPFRGCSGVTSITVDANNTVYDSRDNCNAIIKKSNNRLLVGCKNTVIPSDVTSIDDNAFYNCVGLTSITIPSGVTSIGNTAFYGCSSLTSIEIPSGVTTIYQGTFRGCSSLTSITIPSGVTSIYSNAFRGCSSLTSIEIPSSVTSISEYAFDSCSSLKVLIIPDTVTSMGNNVAQRCSSLQYLKIGNGVTTSLYASFLSSDGYTLTNLRRLVIGTGISSINARDIDTICPNLTEFGTYRTTAPSIANATPTPFTKEGFIIYVPSPYSGGYQSGTWSLYRDKMVYISQMPEYEIR